MCRRKQTQRLIASRLVSFLGISWAWGTFTSVTVWWGVQYAGGSVANEFGLPTGLLPVWIVCMIAITRHHYAKAASKEGFISTVALAMVHTMGEFAILLILTGVLVTHARASVLGLPILL